MLDNKFLRPPKSLISFTELLLLSTLHDIRWNYTSHRLSPTRSCHSSLREIQPTTIVPAGPQNHMPPDLKFFSMADGLDSITRWQIPPSDLTWDIDANCQLFADFANNIIRRSSEYSMWDYCAIDPDALRAYVLSSLPPDLQEAATNATSSDITLWYMLGCDYADLQNDCNSEACRSAVNFRDAVFGGVTMPQFCVTELRSRLGMQGNADIAGIGVSYTTEAHYFTSDSDRCRLQYHYALRPFLLSHFSHPTWPMLSGIMSHRLHHLLLESETLSEQSYQLFIGALSFSTWV